MPEPNASLRLDLIQTQWSLLRQAHAQGDGSPNQARNALVLRYGPAIRKFVGLVVRDENVADEVAQEVMVRLLRGDFAGADLGRGRFRDLLKTAIRNMVRNHLTREGRRQGAVYDLERVAHQPNAEDEPGDTAWRGHVLNLAWAALEQYERDHAGSVAYTLLRLRTDSPDLSSGELADKLGAKLGKPVSVAALRQQLHRARLRFAELLVREIAEGLDSTEPNVVQDELIALGLYESVREFLPPEWASP